MNKTLLNNRKTTDVLLVCALLFLVGLFIYSCFGRSINVDDGWLGEPAMWFARDGYIHSMALRGWENAEVHLFFTHKLLVILGGLFVKAFGYSVYALKSVSAFYLILLTGSWIYFFKKMHLSTRHILVFLILLLGNSLVFEYAFIFRPEIALAFFASWVWFLLRDEKGRQSMGISVLAGAITAVAIGHHLNGVIIAGAGCVLLLMGKRYRNFLVFGTIAALGFLFYFIEVRSMADIHTMLAQFSNTQDMRGEKSVFKYLFNLFDEQRRFLHSPREISITLLLLTCLGVGRNLVKGSYSSLLVFMASMMVLLALIAHGKTSKYLILYMPFMVFLMTVVLLEKWQTYKKTLGVLAFFYGVFQMPSILSLSQEKNHLDEVLTVLVGDLPKGTKILGPMEAVFWAWDKYDLQAFEVYEIYNLRGTLDYQNDALAQLSKFGTEAILFRGYMRDNFGAKDAKFGDFELVHQTPDGLLSFYLKK